jgi:ABC-type branched-subunit amino acid transport system ATPase component
VIPEDTGYVMETGEIVLSGPAAESNTRVVEAYLGESFD